MVLIYVKVCHISVILRAVSDFGVPAATLSRSPVPFLSASMQEVQAHLADTCADLRVSLVSFSRISRVISPASP